MIYKNYEIRRMENTAATRSVWYNIYVPGSGGQIMQPAYSEAEAKRIVDQHIADTATWDAATQEIDMPFDVDTAGDLANGR